MSFVDIAGIVRARPRGEGWATSSSPTSVRPTRSVQVVRAFGTATSSTSTGGSIRPPTSRRSTPSSSSPTCRPSRGRRPPGEGEAGSRRRASRPTTMPLRHRRFWRKARPCMPRGRLPGSTWSWRRGWGCSRPNPSSMCSTSTRTSSRTRPCTSGWRHRSRRPMRSSSTPSSRWTSWNVARDQLEMLEGFGASESGLDQLARTGFTPWGCRPTLTAGPKGSRGPGRSVRAGRRRRQRG